ncbi:protein disulfide isomerase-like 1-4 isoform X4 [Panicum virgatum]|uniref:protein disulfide isomerase-like 1-4 isoform X4 n=1 Tax=Panicum virgatum TaxID=38727 RepID=UPI0019D52F9B|nr:protein disulfide isomerase-like 1-4 isoform X4 [Panicum virgatum]
MRHHMAMPRHTCGNSRRVASSSPIYGPCSATSASVSGNFQVTCTTLPPLTTPRRYSPTFFRKKKEHILTEDNHAVVVAFLDSLHGCYSDELAAAAKMEERVSFYRTTNPEIARLFHIDTAAKLPCLILLTKEEEQFTLYDGEFKRYAIANFVSANKLPLLPTLTQNTVSSLDGHPIKKLACHIVYNYNWISFMHSLIPFPLLLHIYTYPLYSNQIILLAVANESSKFLPSFKEAAKSFTGKLLFFFLEKDSEECKQAAKLLYIPCTGEETTVLAYTTEDKREIPLDSEVSLDTIKKFAQDFLEDKLVISGTVPESIYHPMYHPDLPMKTTNNLAKLLRDINSLVIAKMNGATNWHPRAKLRLLEFFKILFYPAGRKRFEPIAFEGSSAADVVEYYKFIKKHAGIPFEPISALEQVGPDHGATETEIEEPPRLP